MIFPLLNFIIYLTAARAAVTVYQLPLGAGTTTTAAASANYTGSAAYDPTVLNPPDIPDPAPPTQFTLQLQTTSAEVQGISIAIPGDFLGFSIEFSVINQVLGINSTYLQVPFLNLMGIINERVGRVRVRVGGNTQETATIVPSLADGKMMEKDKQDTSNPTATPALLFTPEVLYMLSNISSLVNTKWYLGVPLNDSSNLRLGIVEYGEAILGDNLLGWQVGNEPDLYAAHDHRPSNYTQYDYFGEFGVVLAAMQSDANIKTSNNLIGPSLATGAWTPEMVWDTGFITSYSSNLYSLSVEHYPNNNCFAQFGVGTAVDPQTVFPTYLNHEAGRDIISPYLNSSAIAQAAGLPLMMFETNTASCGGFPGISDSFASALWGLDYGLQMAYSNFSGALLHVGGQDAYYNPFTPPPTNQSTYHQWSIGPIFYSALVVAEALGPTNTSQVMDLLANDDNTYTPAYAIYENGSPSKVALFNYVTDSTGASDYTATISIGGGTTGQSNGTPSQVKVKYLAAPSVSEKVNITWAGQTFGANFESDGRLKGDLDVKTVTCDQTNNVCLITVPAPGFALVFLSDDAFDETPSADTMTFPTTAVTKTYNTVTVDPSVLATSNGHSGSTFLESGSTSKGKVYSPASRVFGPGVLVLIAVIAASELMRRTLSR